MNLGEDLVNPDVSDTLEAKPFSKRTWVGLLGVEIVIVVMGMLFPWLTLAGIGGLMGLSFLVLFVPSRPEWFYYLVIMTSALDYFGTIMTGQTFNLTYFHVTLLLTIASYITYAIMNQRWTFPVTRFNMPFLAFWGMALFSLFYCANWKAGAIMCIRLFFLAILFFLTVLIVRTKPKMQWTIFFLLFTVVAISVIATYQLVTNREFLPPELANRFGHGINRAEGTFANANWMAAFVMIGTILSFSFLLNLPTLFWKKMVLVGVGASSALALLASFSRSGWLSVAIGIGLVPFLSGKLKGSLKFLPLIPLSVLLLFLMFPHVEEFTSRFSSIFVLGTSNASRIYLIISGFWIFLDHPLFGIGIRSFPVVYEESYIHPDMPLTEVIESHTLPVEVLAELGIIGFLILIWLFYVVIREGFLAIKTVRDRYLRALQIGLLAGFLALMVNNLFNNNLADNFLWIMMGLIFAVRRIDVDHTSMVVPK